MVCDHCSSESQVTGYKDCPNNCTVCKDAGYRRNSRACLNRTGTRCSTRAVGHSARECTICSLCDQHGHKKADCPGMLCSACNSSQHKTSRSSDCPHHECSTCGNWAFGAKLPKASFAAYANKKGTKKPIVPTGFAPRAIPANISRAEHPIAHTTSAAAHVMK